jgi:glyoxylase I family protein
MPAPIRGIHHIALKCKDVPTFEQAVSLYRDILEMPVTRMWEKDGFPCALVDTGAGYLELFSNAGSQQPAGVFAHLALRTADPDGWISRVRQAGYEVFMEPKDIALPSDPPLPARIAFFRGPAGEEIEFFAEK